MCVYIYVCVLALRLQLLDYVGFHALVSTAQTLIKEYCTWLTHTLVSLMTQDTILCVRGPQEHVKLTIMMQCWCTQPGKGRTFVIECE